MPPLSKVLKMPTGEEIECFYIKTLADELGRTSQTVRKWELAGVIPATCFRDNYNKRLYTREHIDAVVKCAEKAKINQGKLMCNTSFTKNCGKEFARINAKYKEKMMKGK